jgi:hypothetical protein
MKRYVLLIGFFMIIRLMATTAWASPPQVQDVTITDVTPVSFSVVWASDQSSICDVSVFTDANGTDEIVAGLMITPHPTRNGDPAVAAAAQSRGVMKIRVTGLAHSTTYYFRTRTTSMVGAEETFYPLNAPYLSVTTAAGIAKTTGIDEVPYTNELIYRAVYQADGTTPAQGALLLASIEGGRYPLSGFVGDGFASPLAMIDLNNFYCANSGETLDLQGGQKIVLTTFYGIDGRLGSAWVLPRNQGLLAARLPLGLADAILILQTLTVPRGGSGLPAIADSNQDGRIGLHESMHILQVVAKVR